MFQHPAPRVRRASRLAFLVLLGSLAAPAGAQQGFDQPPPATGAYEAPPPPNAIWEDAGTPDAGGARAPGANDWPAAAANTVPSPGGYPAAPGAGASAPSTGFPAAPAGGFATAPGAASFPPGAGAAGANPMQGLLQAEMQDFGIPPQPGLQTNLHGPTPTRIPGGQVITTDRLLALYHQAGAGGLLVFHVLGPGPMLPGAQQAAPASQPGTFEDATQQEFGRYLQQVTQGDQARPMVFYCQGPHCWMSYNAALRAIHLGYRQVYWYRGGIEAWDRAQQLAAGNAPGNQPYPGSRPERAATGWEDGR